MSEGFTADRSSLTHNAFFFFKSACWSEMFSVERKNCEWNFEEFDSTWRVLIQKHPEKEDLHQLLLDYICKWFE